MTMVVILVKLAVETIEELLRPVIEQYLLSNSFPDRGRHLMPEDLLSTSMVD